MATTVQELRKSDIAANGTANRVATEDRAAHEWYRFVLSFPPHLVRRYCDRFGLGENSWVLDPFCGTGTTLVENKRLGIPSVGVEAHPMAHFASSVKVDWTPDPTLLLETAKFVADSVWRQLSSDGISDEPFCYRKKSTVSLRSLPPESQELLLESSISPLPLHKTLLILQGIDRYRKERFFGHLRLALAKSTVHSTSNLHFGPEVGVTTPKEDAPVVLSWLAEVEKIARDLAFLKQYESVPSKPELGDSRSRFKHLAKGRLFDAVITSPPYPNEKDYTRTTRLEAVLLGFIRTREELRLVKKNLLRSNTRSVYKLDDDHLWVEDHKEINRIANAIEARRIDLGKTSGFERLYARVTRLYFGGMKKHLRELQSILRPGAHLAYVVGDQASYLRVLIRTGELLADIASSLGYQVIDIDLFRTRLATATRAQLREEVVVLKWPGKGGR